MVCKHNSVSLGPKSVDVDMGWINLQDCVCNN
jgi:hypothetical protein